MMTCTIKEYCWSLHHIKHEISSQATESEWNQTDIRKIIGAISGDTCLHGRQRMDKFSNHPAWQICVIKKLS